MDSNVFNLKINLNNIKHTQTINGLKLIKNEDIDLLYLGNIYDKKSERISIKELSELYKNFGEKINLYLDGIYSLCIIDYKKNKIFIFQDDFGSSQSIYFYRNDNYISISNNLKQIIVSNINKWNINKKAVKEFIIKGYISNSNTLIKEVKKIPSKRYLEIDFKKQRLKINKNYNKKKNKIKVTEEIYNETFKSVCLSTIHKNENIAVTVSSGYDTNYILNILSNSIKHPIYAFSIGGKIGRNEVPDAKEICNAYDNVKFQSQLVDGSSLKKYPEIVWALEGAIYESGVFLQYELAKLIKSNDCQYVILGECADQVLNYEFYHPSIGLINKIIYNIKKIPNKIFKNINYKPYKDIYEMASYKVIKKNGIIMNYFNINTEYPYLRNKFINVAKNVVKLGDDKKLYHKQVINNKLPENITKILKKIGGATELKTLFTDSIKFEDLKEVCKKSKYYKKSKFDDIYYEIDYFMKIIYIELFEKMFIQDIDKYINKDIGNYDMTYFFPELKNKKEVKE